MRPARLTLIALGAFAGLLLLAAILTFAFFDPDDYRDEIERAVATRTGRELVLDGELSLSIFPWLAIETGPARLGDAPGFGPEPFLSFERAQLGVRLLPLVQRRIEIGEVTLESPRLSLVIAEDGRSNWADLASNGPTNGSEAITIAGLVIRNGHVHFEDRSKQSAVVVSALDLKTGSIAIGKPFDVRTAFVFEQEPFAMAVEFAGDVTVTLEPLTLAIDRLHCAATARGEAFGTAGMPIELWAARFTATPTHYVLEAPHGEALIHGQALPSNGIPVTARAARVEADVDTQRAELIDLELDAAGARLTASLVATGILEAPSIAGPVRLGPVAVRAWLPRLGIEPPPTQDPAVLSTLAMSARLMATLQHAELQDLILAFDETNARGGLAVTDFERPTVRFALDVDRLDVDRYLPPESEPGAASDARAVAEIPIDRWRALDVAGELEVGSARIAGVSLAGVRLVVTAGEGSVRVDPSALRPESRAHVASLAQQGTGQPRHPR